MGYENLRRLYAFTQILNNTLQRNAYSLAGNRLLANPFPDRKQEQASKAGEFPTAFQSLNKHPTKVPN